MDIYIYIYMLQLWLVINLLFFSDFSTRFLPLFHRNFKRGTGDARVRRPSTGDVRVGRPPRTW